MNQTSLLLSGISNNKIAAAEGKGAISSDVLETKSGDFFTQLAQWISEEKNIANVDASNTTSLNKGNEHEKISTDVLLDQIALLEGEEVSLLDIDGEMASDAELVVIENSLLNEKAIQNTEQDKGSEEKQQDALISKNEKMQIQQDSETLLKRLDEESQALLKPFNKKDIEQSSQLELDNGKSLPLDLPVVILDKKITSAQLLNEDLLSSHLMVKKQNLSQSLIETATDNLTDPSMPFVSGENEMKLDDDKIAIVQQSADELEIDADFLAEQVIQTSLTNIDDVKPVISASFDMKNHVSHLKGQEQELDQGKISDLHLSKMNPDSAFNSNVSQHIDLKLTQDAQAKVSQSMGQFVLPGHEQMALEQKETALKHTLSHAINAVQNPDISNLESGLAASKTVQVSTSSLASIPWVVTHPTSHSINLPIVNEKLLDESALEFVSEAKKGNADSKTEQLVHQLTTSFGPHMTKAGLKLENAVLQTPLQLSQNQEEAANALSEKVNMMMSKNLKYVDIRLDPPELGRMQIKLSMNQDQASVQFTVLNQSTREVIEQSLPRLREMMQQQGLQLAQSSVQQQDAGSNSRQEFAGDHAQQNHSQGERTNHKKEGFFDNQSDKELENNMINHKFKISSSDDGVDYYA